MKPDYVVVQQPTQPAEQLFLLYHGVGDNPHALSQLGRWFADAFPTACVVCIGGPAASGSGNGSQWFEATTSAEEARTRVAAILPEFLTSVRSWQQSSGIAPAATALVGFSQGGTMVLEALNAEPGLAGRAVIFSGSYVHTPQRASNRATIHLIHGEYDDRVPVSAMEQASERLTALGGDVTLDVVEDLAHAIDQRSMGLALHHLRYTVPRRYFDEALSGASPGDDDVIVLM